ncbi:Bax inhibitor-1/YccA family protein [uncultured Prevotella sp.]|uniref:Bax inhibitor-1/YccA family protein n=1 Tax=uncultured Prevotella sp. TaxID=159272 RepID=UPI0028041311|nr:Bax inhibitor-1/YccA family protein [uncultured Prevotella sp.]
MNEERLYRMIEEKEGLVSLAFPALMRKVYVWMTLALVITGFTAFGIAENPGLVYTIVTNRLLFWGLIIGEFALVMAIYGAIGRLSATAATLLFVLYSIVNGATLSVIFLAYTMTSIASVFFITAGTFAVMAFIGYTTKTDLTSFGKMLMMGLIGIILATVVNIFIGSSMLNMIVSYVGVVVFVGLTAYDSQKIKNLLYQVDNMSEEAQKLALLGSLTLYLDFINLFLMLLRIFGGNRD